jgi:hypothetical protein
MIVNGEYLELYYGRIRVGQVAGPFLSDETWYGIFSGCTTHNDEPLYLRITDYIKFCRDWNMRVKRDAANPPGAAEFDKFADLVSTDDWSVKSENGTVFRIIDAPLFYEDGEITWRQIAK